MLTIMAAPQTHAHISYDDVKAAVPLLEMIDYLGLKRRGRILQCPNADAHKHGDRTPSAYIFNGNRSWHCYTCQAGGTVIDLIMVAHHLSREDAKRALEVYAGLAASVDATPLAPLPPPKPPAPPAPPKPASSEVRAFLAQTQAALAHSPEALAYLEKRRIPLVLALKTGLGYARRSTWPHTRGRGQPRIVAPLTAPDGTLLTLYGRSTVYCEKELKHTFLPGPRGLFHTASLAEDGVILVEGVFNALSCLAAGRPSTALCGLSIREEWWRDVSAPRLILATDNDKPGAQGGQALQGQATAAGKTVYALKAECLQPHKDLNEYWVATGTLPAPLRRRLPAVRSPEAPA